jgi:Domain of unknown function (DUF4251)
MKILTMTLQKILLSAFFASVCLIGVRAQDNESATKLIVESGQFIFHAQTAMPMSGTSRQLTSEYDLKVSKDAVVSYLPFFGRAYSLPYGTTDGGFNFTSRKFDYSVSQRRKGGWQINIKPKDVADFREFSLLLSKTGYGTLQVVSNNRQPISFTGYITSLK